MESICINHHLQHIKEHTVMFLPLDSVRLCVYILLCLVFKPHV